MKLYLIGSLRNAEVPKIANSIRQRTGHDVFDNWFAAGPEADNHWRDYERGRGNGLKDALASPEAQHVFTFDKSNLDSSDGAVLAWPAGKSCHLEFGYIIGKGKPGWILLDGEPERFDVMLNFATSVHTNMDDLVDAISKYKYTGHTWRKYYDGLVYPPVVDNGDGTTSPIRRSIKSHEAGYGHL